jgi:ubiquinone/menaquinone biosynthesis C-methylase UbiE
MNAPLPLAVKFSDPSLVISQMGVEKGSLIADFGCGSGYFSLPLAKLIGEEGKVDCLDILPQALESVESKAKLMGINNITVKRVNLEKEKGSGLADESLDWVILKDMLFQNKNKDIIFQEAYRVLKPGGKSLVLEWNENDSSIGPDRKLRIPRSEMVKLIKENKFTIEKEVNAGDFHYAMVIVK